MVSKGQIRIPHHTDCAHGDVGAREEEFIEVIRLYDAAAAKEREVELFALNDRGCIADEVQSVFADLSAAYTAGRPTLAKSWMPVFVDNAHAH